MDRLSRSSRTSSTGWFLFILQEDNTCLLGKGNSKASLVKSLRFWKNRCVPGDASDECVQNIRLYVNIRPF